MHLSSVSQKCAPLNFQTLLNLDSCSDWEDVLVVEDRSVLQLLHPAPHGHLDNLQAGSVNLLYQAEDRGENIGILKTFMCKGNILSMIYPPTLFFGLMGYGLWGERALLATS